MFFNISDFRKLCMQSTEFHFNDVDKQLSGIEHVLNKRPGRTRTVRTTSVLQRAGFDQSSSAAPTTTNLLQTGKIYVMFCSTFENKGYIILIHVHGLTFHTFPSLQVTALLLETTSSFTFMQALPLW